MLAARFPHLNIISGLGDGADSVPPELRCHDDLAALMPTSGSTGVPRLVQVTHGNLLSNTEAIVRSQHLMPDDRALLILPLSYCFGASVLHSHLSVGGHVVFDRRFMNPNKVLNAIDEHSCTTFAGVPSAYRTLLKRTRLCSHPPMSIRRFLAAGGAVDSESIESLVAAVPHSQVYVMYGSTEATARVATLDPDQISSRPGSVGRPLDNLNVKIVDPDDLDRRPLSAGESGEVCVRGPSVTQGYYRDSDANSDKYADGWLITGDLGHLDSDGFLYIDGRRADFIKSRGLRLSLCEVESFVRQLEGVDDVGVCAVAHEESGEELALFVVAGTAQYVVGLSSRIRSSVPAHWPISSLRIVDALPRTSSGKLDRTGLKATIDRSNAECGMRSAE